MARLQTPEETGKAATLKELEASVRSLYDAFNAHDLGQLSGMCAEDCEWTDIPSTAVFRGPDALRQLEESLITAFPDGQIELHNVVCQGDLVVAEMVTHGTHTGPLRGPEAEIPATGKEVEVRCVEIFQFRGTQIVRGRTYYDAASLMRQLGVSP